MAAATRDRIVDEAMRLFGEQGFKATTIVQIETASGLTPGAGGIYHHFANKEALLAAGVERHLQRLAALRDIRRVFAGVGDLRTELTLMARYLLAELDSEAELLRLLTTEARNRPELLRVAVDQLVGQTLDEFTGWLAGHGLAGAEAYATLTLGALLSTRLLDTMLGLAPRVDDAALVDAWVELLSGVLDGH
jgi:AcrR family transcriptional regulator